MKTNLRDIDKILANASASLAVEGMKPSESGVAITRQYLERRISSKDAVNKIIAMHLKQDVR